MCEISANFIELKFVDTPIKKIGIFTRLTSTKPLDRFIDAFHLMVQQKEPLVDWVFFEYLQECTPSQELY